MVWPHVTHEHEFSVEGAVLTESGSRERRPVPAR
jgi:hypothetical protein